MWLWAQRRTISLDSYSITETGEKNAIVPHQTHIARYSLSSQADVNCFTARTVSCPVYGSIYLVFIHHNCAVQHHLFVLRTQFSDLALE